MKLDRLLAKHRLMGRSRARAAILARRVQVDGTLGTRFDQEIDRFMHVTLNGELVQAAARRLCLMLNKPLGVVSATRDDQHPTVLDLIDDPDRDSLHLVGRLDRFTSGLVLLTNDGRWSKALMHPTKKVPKTYHVTTRDPIPADAPARFAAGFYFHTENLTTRPSELTILTPHTARLVLHEGRYHQIKRMFHRLDNRVTALHREAIGNIALPSDLASGAWRSVPRELCTVETKKESDQSRSR